MYLRRKIDDWLSKWKSQDSKIPALVVGIRQCGKTESIKNFASKHFKNIIYMNFWNNPEYISLFDKSIEVNDLIQDITIQFPETKIDKDKTLIFFDEIQECPRARLSFKNFKSDGRYYVIGSGSYLGINGYVIGDATAAPTGCEQVYNMNTMDFEEFLWASNYDEKNINELYLHFKKREKVPESSHNKYKKLFKQYLCVGGFPESVTEFLKTHNIADSITIMNRIVFDMKTDFGRRKDKNNQPVFKAHEVARIQNVFDLIPTFLAKESKRFITSKISNGSSIDKSTAIEYLVQSHIVYKVHNLDIPSLPLKGNKIDSQFKLFPTDISILTNMYGVETIQAIYFDKLGIGKGAIYEALVFDSLYKANIDTFYYAKDTGLEIDFVICYDNYSYLVETKAKDGNAKSCKTVMKNKDHYGITKLLKIGDYNVGEENDILTIPHYMTFLLGRKDDFIVEDLTL